MSFLTLLGRFRQEFLEIQQFQAFNGSTGSWNPDSTRIHLAGGFKHLFWNNLIYINNFPYSDIIFDPFRTPGMSPKIKIFQENSRNFPNFFFLRFYTYSLGGMF